MHLASTGISRAEPGLTVPIAELNRLQAQVLDHLFTGASRAVHGVRQARSLHRALTALCCRAAGSRAKAAGSTAGGRCRAARERFPAPPGSAGLREAGGERICLCSEARRGQQRGALSAPQTPRLKGPPPRQSAPFPHPSLCNGGGEELCCDHLRGLSLARHRPQPPSTRRPPSRARASPGAQRCRLAGACSGYTGGPGGQTPAVRPAGSGHGCPRLFCAQRAPPGALVPGYSITRGESH